MKLNDLSIIKKRINILFVLIVIFAFFKLIYFTCSIQGEMYSPVAGSSFVLNRYIISYAFCSFAFFAFALIFNGSKSVKAIIILDIILALFMFFNLIYYRSFESYLSVYNVSQYRNFGVVGSSALALLQLKDILLFIDPIFLIATYSFWVKLADEREPLTKKQQVIMAIIPIACTGIVMNYNKYFPTTITKVEAGAKYSIVGHHYHDLSSYISDTSTSLNKRDIQVDVEDWLKVKNKYHEKGQLEGAFKGKNVVFIQFESLEEFVINLKVENQEITPTLNKMMKNGLYFDNIIAQENGGNSSDADFLVNTSLLPLKSGSVSHRYPENHYNSLPVILRKQNYSSHVIHSGKGYFWNKENFLPNLGFDSYTDIEGMSPKEEELYFLGLKDEDHFKRVAQKIKEQQDKYYLFTVTETSHTPFELPDEMNYLKFSNEMEKTVFGRYFQSIHYTDKAIGKLMNQLKKDGTLDDTVFVFYGDHEGIHKYNNESVLKKQSSDYKKYANNNKVPLLIYSSDFNKPETISKQGGQVDIMPTVLSLLGIDEEEYLNSTMGINLLEDNQGYAIDKSGRIFTDITDKEELKNIKKSIEISSDIIKSNYFKESYLKPPIFKYNNEIE